MLTRLPLRIAQPICILFETPSRPPARGKGRRSLAGAAAASSSAFASGVNSEEGTPQPSQTLADRLSYLSTPLPFKSPAYTSRPKTKKSAKQILAMERDRAAGVTSLSVVGSRVQSRKPSPVKTGDGGNSKEADDHEVKEKRKLDNIITYFTPTAPPSLLPPKKYCDITGLPAKYTDPKTRLNYRGLEVWDVIRSLGPGYDQAYLAIRKANHTIV